MTQDNRASASFPLELARRLADIKWSPTFDFLYYHQNIARVYFDDPTTRGLLIYHGTGMGKSMLAASIAMDAIFPPDDSTKSQALRARRVIVLLAKSLAENMFEAIEQYVAARIARGGSEALGAFGALVALPEDKRVEWIRRTFSFVTMNASNMLAQMARASFISEEDEDLLFDKKAADFSSTVADLNGKLLIVDEAHNFFRAITNGSHNAAVLYEQIMRAKDLKIAFLTGTSIATNPFEMAMCFNMLAGSRVFPIAYEDFTRLFVGYQGSSPSGRHKTIINREKFQNRIFGLVSYVNYASTPGVGTADILASASTDPASIVDRSVSMPTAPTERAKQRVEFPEEYPFEIVRVPMTVEQYDAYIVAREREKSEGINKAARGGGAKVKVVIKSPMRFRARDTPALQKPRSEFSSSYRVHSRQTGNYCPPEIIRRQLQQGDISLETTPVASILDSIGTIESVKFSAILDKITTKHKAQLGLIYSQFVGLGGLAALARFLDQHGYAGNYAVISGEIPVEERTRIIDRFCDPSNMHGGSGVSLLLVSSTGAEGIDLKNVRHVHILEPYWNFGRIKQVKARAIRNQSHADLPPEERNVSTYIYVAVPPPRSTPADDAPPEEPTSDEELYANSREIQLLIDSFESAIKEVSIECAINHRASERASHCRICAPTDARLFTDNIAGDVAAADPCTPITSKRVVAKKIKVADTTFSYKTADPGSIESRVYGFEVFVEDPRLRAWRKLALNDARYSAVVAAIVADLAAQE